MVSEQESEGVVAGSMGLGIMASGLFFTLVGLPLTYIFAVISGRDPIISILLAQADHDITALLSHGPFSRFSYSDVSIIAAVLALYGVGTLIIPLLFYVVKRDGYLKLLTLSWGIFLGLSLASTWFDWASGRPMIFGTERSYPTRIAYIYFVFLVAESSKLIVARRGLLALPYLYAFDGLFGIAAVLIISAGYDPTFASLLLGPAFLVAVAVAILLAEWMILRPGTILMLGFGKLMASRAVQRMLEAPGVPLRSKLAYTFRRYRAHLKKAKAEPYAARADRIERFLATIFRPAWSSLRHAKLRRVDWSFFAVSFLIWSVFPFFTGALCLLIF